jgi:hypothetical protein
MWSRWLLAALLFVALPRVARAAELAIPSSERRVEVHGFVSPGFILTTKSNYLAKSRRGSFEFNEVGLNFTVPLTEKLRTGVQLFARDLGPQGNYSPRADWFYLDYRFEDYFGLRAGRARPPATSPPRSRRAPATARATPRRAVRARTPRRRRTRTASIAAPPPSLLPRARRTRLRVDGRRRSPGPP